MRVPDWCLKPKHFDWMIVYQGGVKHFLPFDWCLNLKIMRGTVIPASEAQLIDLQKSALPRSQLHDLLAISVSDQKLQASRSIGRKYATAFLSLHF